MLKTVKGISISLIAAGLLVLAIFGYFSITGSIFPNVHINGVDVGFQSQRQVVSEMSATTNGFERQTITILTKNKKMSLQVSDVASISDLNSVVETAYRFGRDGSFFDNLASFFDIIINGRSVPLDIQIDEETLREQLTTLAEQSISPPKARQYVLKDEQLLIDGGGSGTMLDVETAVAELKDRILNFNWANYSAPYTEIAPPPIDLQQAWSIITKEPVDAYYDVNLKQIVPAVNGVSFDIEAARDSINLSSTEVQSIPLTYQAAAVQAEDLEDLLFQDVLGKFTTYFGGASNRATNITLCAASINEVVVQPGGIFSFNTERDETTPENGYKKAGVFENGRTVQDYGGGVCQVSSTLYVASLYANMETVERYNHMFTVSYMDISMDATVYAPTLDFRFKNTSPYPIKIVTETKNGSLTVSIVGTKTDDVEVTLTPKRLKNSNGYKNAELWKTVTINGETTTVKENSSRYKG